MRSEQWNKEKLDAYTEQLIREVEAEGMIHAPAHMKQEILERSKRVDYQLAATGREMSRQMQFLFYSLKVGAAVVTALFLLFMVPRELPQTELMSPQEASRQQEETLNRRLNNGMRQINQMLNTWMGFEDQDQMED